MSADPPIPAPPADASGSPVRARSRIARNVASNWATTVVTLLSTLFITPLVVSALQRELYGVWSFLVGLLSYADLLYLGLGGAFVRGVAMCRAGGKQAELNRLASVVFFIYLVLGTVSLAVFGSLGWFVDHVFAQPLSAEATASIAAACALLGVQLFLNFVSSSFAGILYGSDRIDLINAVRIAVILGRAAAIVLWIDGAHPLVILPSITAGFTALEAAAMALIVHGVDGRLRVRPVVPSRAELAPLYSFGLKSFAIVFATTLINYTDTTVVGVMLGAASVAVYTLPLQLVEYVRVLAIGASSALLPRLAVLVHDGDWAGLREAYLRGTRVVLFLASFATAQLFTLGPAFLAIWVGPEFGAKVHGVIICLGTAALLHVFAVVVPYTFYQAMDRMGTPARILVIEAVANAVLSVALAPWLGILGVAIGTLVPAIAASAVLLPAYFRRLLSVPTRDVLAAVLPSAALIVVVVLTQWVAGAAIGSASYLELAARVTVTVGPVLLVFWLGFPREDRLWVVNAMRRVAGHRSLPE
jgi:O-antigen/teichoic acid export membrane protein